MKTAYVILALLLSLSTDAYAGTMTVGKQKFDFSVPDGYQELQKGRSAIEDKLIDILDDFATQEQSVIAAAFLSQESWQIFSDGGDFRKFGLMMYHTEVAELYFTIKEFKALKKDVINALGNSDSGELTVLEDSVNCLVTLMFMSDDSELYRAEISRFEFMNGKVFQLIYHEDELRKADMPKAAENSKLFFKGLRLTPAGGPNPPTPYKDFMSIMPILFIVAAIMMYLLKLIVDWAFYFLRKNSE